MNYQPYSGQTFADIAQYMTLSPAYAPAIVRANGFQTEDGQDVSEYEDASQFGTITIPDAWLLPEYKVVSRNTGGAVVGGSVDWFDKLIDNAPKILAAFNAQQIAQINVDRASRGLPPINATAYGPQIGVGLNPATQTLVMYAALGFGALYLLKRKG